MSDEALRLVLEQFDETLHTIGEGYRVDVSAKALKECFSQFADLLGGRSVFMSRRDLGTLPGIGSKAWCSSSEQWVVRRATEEDDWGYRLHDGRELALMLAGKKPFGFVMLPKQTNDPRPAIFERLANEGRIKLKVVDAPRFTTFLLAVSGEEWRWSAFALLQEVASKAGWTPAVERFLGRLLGYSDREIDIYLEKTSA